MKVCYALGAMLPVSFSCSNREGPVYMPIQSIAHPEVGGCMEYVLHGLVLCLVSPVPLPSPALFVLDGFLWISSASSDSSMPGKLLLVNRASSVAFLLVSHRLLPAALKAQLSLNLAARPRQFRANS